MCARSQLNYQTLQKDVKQIWNEKVANLDLMESDWPSRPTIPQYTVHAICLEEDGKQGCTELNEWTSLERKENLDQMSFSRWAC